MSAGPDKSSSEDQLLTCEEVDDLDTPTYPNVPGVPFDEQRRAFIFVAMASPEIDGKILVENMTRVEQWLTGKVEKLSVVHGKKERTKPASE